MAISLSWEEFLSQSRDFLTISNQINDGWILEGKTDVPGETFLKKIEITPNIIYQESSEDGDLDTFQYDMEDSQSIIAQETIKKEFNILYNMSYGVPELFFNMWKNDGTLISLENLWSSMPKNFEHLIKEKKWTILTQKEHSIYHIPYYHLHPCKTSELIDTIQNSRNSMVTWLSSVAPLAGLHIDLKYAELI